jgi:hypothetical protein
MDLKTKFRAVLARERSWATSVARNWIKPRPISVWEVLIPVLLVFLYAKSRTDREVMVQNLLFTKEQALRAALDSLEEGTEPEESMAPFFAKTQPLLDAGEAVYSEAIQRAQLEEIRLLRAHYLELLRAEGDDHDTLVRNAYASREAYEAFLARLRSAEAAVNRAALETLGPRGDSNQVARMEETYDRLRAASADRIFPPSEASPC